MPELTLEKELFYKFADKLEAKIRFNTDWTSLSELTKSLRYTTEKSISLYEIKDDIITELDHLNKPSPKTYESVCSSMLRLIEKWFRIIRDKKSWTFKDNNLDQLINGFLFAGALSSEEEKLLRIISKPYRDYVLHGHEMPLTVSKVLLTTVIDIYLRLADSFDKLFER